MNSRILELFIVGVRAIVATALIIFALIILTPFLFIAIIFELAHGREPGRSLRQILEVRENEEEEKGNG